MKRFLPVIFALLLPAALFAQGHPKMDETSMLKGFGLTDAQITQVQTIEKSTREAVRADFTHIRLVQAQIAEALLPGAKGPDVQAINALIDRKGQFRTDIDKVLMSASLQLRQIMGDEHFAQYRRFVMSEMRSRFRRVGPQRSSGMMGPQAMTGGMPPMEGERFQPGWMAAPPSAP